MQSQTHRQAFSEPLQPAWKGRIVILSNGLLTHHKNRLLESAGELTNHGTFLDAELPEFRPAGGQAKASRLAFKHEGMHDACEDRDGMIIIGRNAHT